MAQLYFYYSAMNAGKTTRLLQSAFNYEEMGLKVLCFLPEEMATSPGAASEEVREPTKADTEGSSTSAGAAPEGTMTPLQTAVISSRVGMSRSAVVLTKDFDIMKYLRNYQEETGEKISCILLDEVQFLKKAQVMTLCQIVDQFKIPVLAYGLRSDFRGRLFEGSQWLLAWADKLIEVKAVCFCGKKAVMTARIHSDGTAVQEGPQVQILGASGGNDIYTSLCRKHYRQLFHDQVAIQDLRTNTTATA